MRALLKPLLLVLGFGLVVWLLWQADPGGVWRVMRALGPWAPLFLGPYGLVYFIDTLGWRLTFGRHLPQPLTLGRLIRIRWAGEAVNALVPSGYLGGEGVKVYLLHQAGVSGWMGATSVVVSKTVQILAQVLFISLGALLGALHLPSASPFRPALWTITGIALGVLLLLIGAQYYGFFKAINRVAVISQRWRGWFERHRQRIQEVDAGIRSFYQGQPQWFLLSLLAYFTGWLGGILEVWLVSTWLGWPIDWSQAVAIEAFISVAKALGTFVPASLGVQESGVVLLFHAFGLTSSQALAYALLRRGRELVFALVGLGFLWSEGSNLKLLKSQIKQI